MTIIVLCDLTLVMNFSILETEEKIESAARNTCSYHWNSQLMAQIHIPEINDRISLSLGKLSKQIFGKSWEFGPTGLTPPSPNVGIFSVNFSEIFGKKGSNMP